MNLKSTWSITKTRLKKNFIAFHFAKRKAARHYVKPDVSKSKHPDILQTLLKDGIIMIPGFYSPAEVEETLCAVRSPLEEVRTGKFTGPQRTFAAEAQYRLLDIDQISPTSKRLFEDPMINTLAREYVGEEVVCYQKMAELRCDIGRNSIADLFHFDDWRHRFKSFLYLTDVGPENAPLAYLKGSHIPGKWRNPKELDYFVRGKAGTYGHFVPMEIEAIKQEQGFEELVCTGKSGTLILADTRGVHRGTALQADHRIILGGFYDVRSF